MAPEFDLSAFEQDLDETLARGREAFRGTYAQELNELAGLSRAQIDAICPGTTDLETYDALVTVVKEASRANLASADLKLQIGRLGSVAKAIALKVPSLARLLV